MCFLITGDATRALLFIRMSYALRKPICRTVWAVATKLCLYLRREMWVQLQQPERHVYPLFLYQRYNRRIYKYDICWNVIVDFLVENSTSFMINWWFGEWVNKLIQYAPKLPMHIWQYRLRHVLISRIIASRRTIYWLKWCLLLERILRLDNSKFESYVVDNSICEKGSSIFIVSAQ